MHNCIVGRDRFGEEDRVKNHSIGYRVASGIGKSRQKAVGGRKNLINRCSGVRSTILCRLHGCLQSFRDGFERITGQ